MSETGEECEFQSDQIVDKKRLEKSIIWNWFGYFKNEKAQKMTACVYQAGKHEQPIEAPETVAPSDNAESLGLRIQESPSTSSSGAQTSIDCVVLCCHFPYERRSKRSVDINNVVSYFIAKGV